jgi:hypothetical protein
MLECTHACRTYSVVGMRTALRLYHCPTVVLRSSSGRIELQRLVVPLPCRAACIGDQQPRPSSQHARSHSERSHSDCRIFNRFDLDSDGVWSLDELQAFSQACNGCASQKASAVGEYARGLWLAQRLGGTPACGCMQERPNLLGRRDCGDARALPSRQYGPSY